MSIPKIIHQIWLGNEPVPIQFIQTWKRHNPDWQHILWTETEVEKFGVFNREKYDFFTSHSSRSDVLRYEILYTMGGLYLDADTVCMNSIGDYFDGHSLWVVPDTHWTKLFCGSMIACEPRHPALEQAINLVRELEPKSKSLILTTGPKLWTKAVEGFEKGIAPRDVWNTKIDRVNHDTICIHLLWSYPENYKNRFAILQGLA